MVTKKEKPMDADAYKRDPNPIRVKPEEKSKGSQAFQDLADEFISVVFGEDTLERLKKKEAEKIEKRPY